MNLKNKKNKLERKINKFKRNLLNFAIFYKKMKLKRKEH